MAEQSIYSDIATRTAGDIYIGVVGPVRTGKSTFIKNFMETLVIPNIKGDYRRERATDELPQSSAGRTIMTTEPKFIPEEAALINVDENASLRVRMIDCVGYIVPSSLGYVENNAPRMVMTPWFNEEIPFNMAAEIGTQKVITEHSTIGLVVTTDGSISDIPRAEYEEAELRVIDELKGINKPFVVVLNCQNPQGAQAQELRAEMAQSYGVPVLAANCLELEEDDIREILSSVLYEFPVKEISVEMPRWVLSLSKDHWLKSSLMGSIFGACNDITHMRQMKEKLAEICLCENIKDARQAGIDLGHGAARISVVLQEPLFYKVLSETTGIAVASEEALMPCMTELAQMKREYEKVRGALEQVEATGYGIVMPALEELTLEEPEIIKQGGRYGVRLRASAPSIHMMRATINTEVNPIVGSEKQSEDLIMYLLKEFEESPAKIWDSNIFGKSLHELVNEGLHNKLYRMPDDARMKLQETIERIINEGCTGLICIIL
ncbi:MAG: stage IV sporulation protein A [Hydrogenoanaerobacterium sp.]